MVHEDQQTGTTKILKAEEREAEEQQTVSTQPLGDDRMQEEQQTGTTYDTGWSDFGHYGQRATDRLHTGKGIDEWNMKDETGNDYNKTDPHDNYSIEEYEHLLTSSYQSCLNNRDNGDQQAVDESLQGITDMYQQLSDRAHSVGRQARIAQRPYMQQTINDKLDEQPTDLHVLVLVLQERARKMRNEAHKGTLLYFYDKKEDTQKRVRETITTSPPIRTKHFQKTLDQYLTQGDGDDDMLQEEDPPTTSPPDMDNEEDTGQEDVRFNFLQMATPMTDYTPPDPADYKVLPGVCRILLRHT
eukprot:gene36220-47112_t